MKKKTIFRNYRTFELCFDFYFIFFFQVRVLVIIRPPLPRQYGALGHSNTADSHNFLVFLQCLEWLSVSKIHTFRPFSLRKRRESCILNSILYVQLFFIAFLLLKCKCKSIFTQNQYLCRQSSLYLNVIVLKGFYWWKC